MNKGGLSAIVATVLIILITIVSVSIIWISVVPMINDNIKTQDVDARLDILTSNGFTAYDATKGVVQIQIKRGSDNSNITAVKFVLIFDGNSESHINYSVPGPNEARSYLFDVSIYGEPTEIRVIPIFDDGKEGFVTSQVDIPKADITNIEGAVRFSDECKSDDDCSDDVNICNGLDWTSRNYSCVNGMCETNETLIANCDDDNECTEDSCDVGNGCSNISVEDYISCSSGICLNGNCNSTPSWMNGLVSWWGFEDNFKDKVGSNDCVANGDVTFVDGIFGKGADFDGDGDYLDCGNNSNILIKKAFTIIAWVNADTGYNSSVGGTGRTVVSTYSNSNFGWNFGDLWKSDQFNFNVCNRTYITDNYSCSNNYCNSSCAVAHDDPSYWNKSGNYFVDKLNVWHQLTGIYAHIGPFAFVNIYEDGNLSSNSGNIPSSITYRNDTHFIIGSRSGGQTQSFFDGTIDEVMIFNRTLALNEIREINSLFKSG